MTFKTIAARTALCSALALATMMPVANAPARAEPVVNGLSGAYLAGRQARYLGDFDAAARYYGQALARDPGNPQIMEALVLADLSQGRIDRALPVARDMEEAGLQSQLSQMVLVSDEGWNKNYDALLKRIEDKRAIGPLVDGLVAAWAKLGKGDMSDAIAQFDEIAKEPGQRGFALYHKALALAMVGDFESAEEILGATGPGSSVQTRRGVIARIEVLSQLGRNEAALEVLQNAFGATLDPELETLRSRLQAGETLPFDIVASARDGMGEVLYTVAGALRGEARDADTILFARMAEYLRPGHVDAILLSAEILDDMEQYDLATATYRRVPQDDPAFHAAELGRADALRKGGKPDAAIEVLEQLAKSYPDLPIVYSSLGDLMRTLDRYDEAVAAYDRAIALIPDPSGGQWFLYYARGISRERIGDWPGAEADLREALKLNPERPEVLNYLGYSLVEKREKLDEALSMIERAVSAQPSSGYIVDSLGWVLYRLGRYNEAVAHMERAAELMPVDPVVNDHLGDVYWAVGRQREAEFQWKRALSFAEYGESTEEADPERIRRKLEIGLDRVLAEEGGKPLKVAGEKASGDNN
ncbi:tetratricopeptide repeat protein [Rhodalgimonas zhirmunskyi]|uniref:Tetratricopeptide repeat protein n=1 Tax=Rhodalgimonas zhirmunskyi TaxID=2964767 RepID=A0AAJ1UCA5_9RHOB|nr:tetratricopeptide repeat protein [Rhodoalgimonas zhirmunskyi]MDQ2093542.1 tetratricopeptide repeat protein [Rhodoalgimonas zhirmunskyi]